jgi:hypothetical protein
MNERMTASSRHNVRVQNVRVGVAEDRDGEISGRGRLGAQRKD